MARDTAGPEETSEPPDPEIGKGVLEAEMGPGSALAHLYRGEIHRMRFWRERLDRTTYWAILIMSAILTRTFSSRGNPHYILLLGSLALVAFLVIEARRFRGYDIWRGRVRTLQRNVWASGLDPASGVSNPRWRREMGEDYREPTMKISREEAIAHRLRRIYLLLFTFLLGAWILRVTAFATVPWPDSAAITTIHGLVVTGIVGLAYLVAVVIAVRPRTWHAEDELQDQAVGRHRDR